MFLNSVFLQVHQNTDPLQAMLAYAVGKTETKFPDMELLCLSTVHMKTHSWNRLNVHEGQCALQTVTHRSFQPLVIPICYMQLSI